MKKVVVHRRREGPRQHPWLFLAGSVIGVGAVVAVVAYLIAGRETPEKKAERLTEELVTSIGALEWQAVREKMGVPKYVNAAKFESWVAESHKIFLSQQPVCISCDCRDVKVLGEGLYEVSYSLNFQFKSTGHRTRPTGVARWRYDVESNSMSYVIDDETKEALGID